MLPRVADEPATPPRNFAFKPKEFERVNAPRPEAGDAAAPPPAANDVYAIRAEIRAREIASGQDELIPVARPQTTRRRRDYWLLLAGGNLALLAVVAFVGPNPMTFIFGAAGVIIYSVGLTWVMWAVMGRY
jgi:hypothetical protein